MSQRLPLSAENQESSGVVLTGFECHVCGVEELVEIMEYSRLPRVTSDCKPFAAGGRLAVCRTCGAVQKPSDARWREEAASIYRHYDIYFQSAGIEQSVFDSVDGIPRLRSQVLLERLNAVSPLAKTGAVLDVGCGKGTFLNAFSKFRPGWRLFGHELNCANAKILARIPQFERLYTGSISNLPKSGFELIVLVHALEHFENPVESLRALAPKLAPGGAIVVEVPNAEASPFDFLVADHASHFTHADLRRLVQRAGLVTHILANDWMAKELSLVAVGSEVAPALAVSVDTASLQHSVSLRVGWLKAVLAEARRAASGASRFGVFGTSITAMWLYGELDNQIDFFVDEDPSRIGNLHGRPVLTPDNIPEQATVFIGLLPEIARTVASRIGRIDIDWKLPPTLP